LNTARRERPPDVELRHAHVPDPARRVGCKQIARHEVGQRGALAASRRPGDDEAALARVRRQPVGDGVAEGVSTDEVTWASRIERCITATVRAPAAPLWEAGAMVDPFSLGALGAVAATEGIKFLYGQATEVIKRWRDRKAGKQVEAEAPIPVAGAEVLAGELDSPKVDFDAAERLHEDIKQLASVLGNYANGLEDPDPDDRDLAAAVDGLRRALEAVYGQGITFKGEQREPSGPVVAGRVDVETVAGDVAGVRARLVRSGRITGEARAGTVEEGGKLSGVDIDTLG
jgi:hypothetical protein